MIWLYLAGDVHALRYSLCRNTKLHFRDKDVTLSQITVTALARMRVIIRLVTMRLDFRQKLNRLQSLLIRHIVNRPIVISAFTFNIWR